MTPETNCPSHIEARERIDEMCDTTALDHEPVYHSDGLTFGHLRAIRTLLATPTQGDISSSRDHALSTAAKLEELRLFLNGEGELEGCIFGQTPSFVKSRAYWWRTYLPVLAEAAAILSSQTEAAVKVPGTQNNTFDTPTQEGVGREEIREAIREAFGKWNARHGNQSHCSIQFIDQLTDLFVSLFPAPKPGEGAEQELADLKASLRDPGVVHVNMLRGNIATPPLRSLLHLYGQDALARWDASEPAPGAPEGWREPSPDEQFALATRIAANVGYELTPEPPLSALTSSSATGGDITTDGPHNIEDHRRWLARQLLDSNLSADEAYSIVEHSPALKSALAQSNRRLREGLTSDSVTPTADLMEFAAARLVSHAGDSNLTDYVQALRREAAKQRAVLAEASQ